MSDTATHTHTHSHTAAPQQPVVLTDKAQTEAKRLLDKEGLVQSHCLRVKVVGGGCSGLSYQLAFDDRIGQDDEIIEQPAGFRVVVDLTAKQYLKGTVIDYVEAFGGGGFQFRNPNAAGTCGCGSSFSV